MKPSLPQTARQPAPFRAGSVPINFLDLSQTGQTDIDPTHGEYWSVPWSDLMMVMFVLFAALLTVQAVKQKEIIETETSNQPHPILHH